MRYPPNLADSGIGACIGKQSRQQIAAILDSHLIEAILPQNLHSIVPKRRNGIRLDVIGDILTLVEPLPCPFINAGS